MGLNGSLVVIVIGKLKRHVDITIRLNKMLICIMFVTKLFHSIILKSIPMKQGAILVPSLVYTVANIQVP